MIFRFSMRTRRCYKFGWRTNAFKWWFIKLLFIPTLGLLTGVHPKRASSTLERLKGWDILCVMLEITFDASEEWLAFPVGFVDVPPSWAGYRGVLRLSIDYWYFSFVSKSIMLNLYIALYINFIKPWW